MKKYVLLTNFLYIHHDVMHNQSIFYITNYLLTNRLFTDFIILWYIPINIDKKSFKVQ